MANVTESNVKEIVERSRTDRGFYKELHFSLGIYVNKDADPNETKRCYLHIGRMLIEQAEAGDRRAGFLYAHLILSAYKTHPEIRRLFSVGDDASIARAHSLLVEASDADVTDATYYLFRFYEDLLWLRQRGWDVGGLSLPVSNESIVTWLEEKGRQGDFGAYYVLWQIYSRGLTGRVDEELAAKYRDLARQWGEKE